MGKLYDKKMATLLLLFAGISNSLFFFLLHIILAKKV